MHAVYINRQDMNVHEQKHSKFTQTNINKNTIYITAVHLTCNTQYILEDN